MKKLVFVFIACFLLLGIWYFVFYGRGKTLDFRGTITEIYGEGGELVFTLDSGYSVTADARTRVSYCCDDDPKILLADIKVGDTIEGDYRLFSDNDAKYITVRYEKEQP